MLADASSYGKIYFKSLSNGKTKYELLIILNSNKGK